MAITNPYSALAEPPADVLARLRAATRDSHARIERNPRLRRLLEPVLDIDDYRELLARLYGFYAPLEERLRAAHDWDGLGFELVPRCKADWLRRDLTALGLTGADIDQLPRCRELPPVALYPQALGVLYVMEGATLGGQIIVRRVPSDIAARAATFYAGYGPRTPEMWNGFRHFMRRQAWSERQAAAAVAAARTTFAALDRWLAS